MKKKLILIFIITNSVIPVIAQGISVHAEDKPLSLVLVEIRDIHGINLSFNDQDLSKFQISVDSSYTNAEQAFIHLTQNIPVEFEKNGNVYIFYKSNKYLSKSASFILKGRVVEKGNKESLPFTHLLINGKGAVTDEFGAFSFHSITDSIFQIQTSHLGYLYKDTVLRAGSGHIVQLSILNTDIDEITVQGDAKLFLNYSQNKAGTIQVNQQVAQLVPGNGDDAVFNILRLQSGILAAGEQSRDLIIWGNYPGFGRLNFDGITVFGLKNYNDNISTINPFMTKDIRIYKGGFGANLGERVGSIINITSVDGSLNRPKVSLNLNNMTMNIKVESPVSSRSSFVAAFRQTYYNLYPAIAVNDNNSEHGSFNNTSIAVSPKYKFQDGNIKYSLRTKTNSLFVFSAFAGRDDFNYSINKEDAHMDVFQDFSEKNSQFGARSLFHKNWVKSAYSQFSLTYSRLHTSISDAQESGLSSMGMGHHMHSIDRVFKNSIEKFSFNNVNNIRLSDKHELEFGTDWILYSSFLIDSPASNIDEGLNANSPVLAIYIQDRLSVAKNIRMDIGLRTNYEHQTHRWYIQPRFHISVNTTKSSQLHFSWGRYNQFISLSSVIDQNNNVSYQWEITGKDEHPGLSSQHFVFGGIFTYNNWDFKVESYYKEIEGVTRKLKIEDYQTSNYGNGKIIGIDFLLKREFSKHIAWLAYSIADSKEWFPYFQTDSYERAIHDQRHEIKLSTILNFSPVYLSANYIYGSGFPPTSEIKSSIYKRFDIAGNYKFEFRRLNLETGISILNLFNHRNIKFSNVVNLPLDEIEKVSIYSDAIPFTPSLFIKASF